MSEAAAEGTDGRAEDGLLVVYGSPTSEELAAAVVAVTALAAAEGAAAGAPARARPGRGWAPPARRMTAWPRHWGTGG
ncbi:acyl-CoA carboxylase epsilon subunit [Kitasatospora sp. NPDC091335]|uniref:acyl-CoA carboxylase epsilon subunit n=1 Tax=Kitasatospora sp. NPDC091335 TaxID=3364085 RepID=UPI00382EF6E1